MDLSSVIPIILAYRYWILLPLACFEGPLLSFIVGILCALGYFDPVVAYMTMLLGDIIPDTGLYLIGRKGAKTKFGMSVLARPSIAPHLTAMRHMWTKHTGKTVFMGKLAYGLAPAFLISAGLAEVPPSTYFSYTIPIAAMQYAVLLGLGYYSGASFATIAKIFNHAEILIAGVIAIGIGYYFFVRAIRDRVLKAEKEEIASE